MTNLTEMWQKIKLKYKWRSGRNKVIKRYEKIMRNFPLPPICAAGEDFELLQKYDYAKKLALFELDMIKKEKEKLREKGYKLMNIPDAIEPELKDEIYSLCKTNKIEDYIK